jgi:hypothetical protein
MSSFPTPITALKLRVSTGSAPNVQTFEESIPPSAISGMTGSHQINNPALISAFNSQSQGTIFNASIVTTYAPGTFPSGNIIPVPSVSNFVPNPIQASLSLATLPQLNPLSPPFSLNDYITKNSPAPLSFSSNNENVLTVSSSGLVTIQGAGQATITIAQPASTDGVYTAATSISRVVDVIPLPYLTWSDITKSVTTRVFPLIGDLAPSSNVPISYGNIWNLLGQDIDGEAAFDFSGTTVSLSADGTIVAIGAPSNDGNGNVSGHVRVYKWNGTIWTQLGQDINGEAANDYSGTSVSLSADGTIVAIGAYGNSSNSGHVRVYKWNGTIWTQLGQDIDGEAAFDNSGHSVSLSADGTIVAIGAPGNNENGIDSGHVRVYKWNGTIWTQLGSDIDGEAAAYDNSGTSVSLSADGTIVAIGAPNNDGNVSNSGHVRVYKWNGTIWTQLGQDIDGEAANDFSGRSVSLSADGTIVAIGAPSNDGNGSNSGHVRVYKWNGTIWTQLGQDINGEAAFDFSGTSVSLSADGTIVAIGASNNDGNGSYNGHVRVYKWNGTIWSQLGQDINGEAANDSSGTSVSLSADGTIVAIGAPSNDGNGSNSGNSGHVRVYKIDIFGNFTYTSDTPAVADVFGNIVLLRSTGDTILTATQSATGNYLSGTVDATLTVTS